MPSVALIIRDFGTSKAKAIAAVRGACGMGLSELNDAFTRGAPVVERELFDRADPKFADRLLALMEELEALGADYGAYELLSGQSFNPRESGAYWQLTPERLRTVIATREKWLLRKRGG